MLELDLLLATFLERDYATLDSRGRVAFAALLETPDQELLDYLMGRTVHREAQVQHVIETIRRSQQA